MPSNAKAPNNHRAILVDRVPRQLTGLGADRSFRVTTTRLKEIAMKWKTPVIVEITVGLEINAYACAEVK
jgi:coenzyme PQQ precursor peptide PqqA